MRKDIFSLEPPSSLPQLQSNVYQCSLSHSRPAERWRVPYWRGLVLRVVTLMSILLSACALALAAGGADVPLASALANGQSTTPAMGWSSWNAHFTNINESVIKAAANALVSSGMKAAGYTYVNIDAGWWSGTRDGSGNITVSSSQWPDGMAGVASYIHGLGLKAGIYTDAGANGCSGTNQGSYGHYAQDMLQFEKWGFDYVKVDWCGGVALGLTPSTQYPQIRDAGRG